MSADTLADYVRSPTNRKLLQEFSTDKFKIQWPRLSEAVGRAVDMVLDDAIDDAIKKFKTWTLTPENIGEVNGSVYKALRPLVERAMKGVVRDPEAELDEMFSLRSTMPQESRSDGIVQDRELETLRDKYLQSWRD